VPLPDKRRGGDHRLDMTRERLIGVRSLRPPLGQFTSGGVPLARLLLFAGNSLKCSCPLSRNPLVDQECLFPDARQSAVVPTWGIDRVVVISTIGRHVFACQAPFKDGKEHRYWSIVENRRTAGSLVVQRQVLYVGEINDSQRAAWCKSIDVLDSTHASSRPLALFTEDRVAPETSQWLLSGEALRSM
jgi:hypothetical protein